MKRQVVIARYDEPMEWAPRRLDCPYIIYNKGERLGVMGEVPLPNHKGGNEAHTFTWHIMECYDCLADWTVFIQGHPFDHCRWFYDRYQDEPASGFFWLGDRPIVDDRNGRPHHKRNIPVGEAYEAITGEAAPKRFGFAAGGQFIASRELIQRKPQSFYRGLFELMGERYPDDWGYIMERLWRAVLCLTI